MRYYKTALRLVAIFLIATCARTASAAATFDDIKRDFRPSDTLVLDRSGEVVQRMRTDSAVRRGQWVGLGDVSPALRTTLLLSEDKRFYEHSGVDWRSVSSAAWGNLWNSRTRGASTISMQLVGLLDDNLRAAAGGRSLRQKIGQTFSSQLLEKRWRKDQILEAYLNLVPFRGEIVGIDALSRTLFGKAPHGLDEREAAIASALVRAPNAKVSVVTQRACGVYALMQAPAKVDCEGLDLFVTGALQRRAFEASEGFAPHFARRLLAQAASKGVANSIQSTLRAPLQRFAVQTLQQQLRELRGRHVEDGAIVVLDNASGEVLAWVGSSGDISSAAEVDGAVALRQPGSTLKPFLYAQAIAERRMTAASLLEDSPTHIPTASGLYIPQNYDHQFKGLVSARTALGASLNVPAVRTLVMVSPDAFFRQLQAFGLPLRESGDYFGYSLALGSSEVSLVSLTNAYRTLVNGGRWGEVQFGLGPFLPSPKGARTSRPAIDPRAAFIVTDIMADPLARTRTFGTDSVLGTRFWSAVKTGTSKDMRDNWAMGFSQRYTVGVWVGNASGAPMWDVSGTSGAAPIWAAVMGYLHKNEASRAPTPPAGLVQGRAQFGSQLEAARTEWFIAGTEQAILATDSIANNARRTSASSQKDVKITQKSSDDLASSPLRITTPANGSIIALDPDIPPNRQRLNFSAEGLASAAPAQNSSVRWLMDGKEFARGATAQWLPWPGRHLVQLMDARGAVLDEIRLEVRGAGVNESGSRRANAGISQSVKSR